MIGLKGLVCFTYNKRPGSALLNCPNCQGRMRLLAVIKEPANIAREATALKNLGLRDEGDSKIFFAAPHVHS